ncbi:spermidine synthase [Alicyclobacillus suci]|uniref:spermidine synthase n=1 Tax=Alicyclobacillus suci TaxID=2816080 RepID=UPI0011BF8F51|nr:spermidine synthase [Alicyclobacillus suci]
MMRFGGRGGWQGAVDEARPDRPVFPYQRAFSSLVWTLPMVQSFLSIGVGTGTALNSVRRHHETAELYGVEIDEAVLNVAIHYFHAPNHREATYYVGDGFAYIRAELPFLYDLIFVDAYMRNAIYQPALDPNSLAPLKAKLMPGGVIAYNLITSNLQSGAIGAFIQAAKSQFTFVLDLPVGIPFSDQNRFVVFTDDAQVVKQWRSQLGRAPMLLWYERFTWPSRLRRI